MSKNIYTKERVRPAYKKKEKEQISAYSIKNIFKLDSLRGYGDNFEIDVFKKYYQICKECGFEQSLFKNEKILKKEAELYIQKKSQLLFKNKNKIKKMKLPEYIKLVESKELKADAIPEFQGVYEVYSEIVVKEDFLLFCEIFKSIKFNISLNQRSKDKVLVLIENIFKYRAKWVNDLKDFKLKTKNTQKALMTLIEFLFCKYIMNPIYLDLMYTKDKSIIFIEIADGKSPKKVIEQYLPEYNLTKKMIHSLNTVKTNLTFNKRIRELQLTGYQNKIVKEVLNSFKGEDFIEEENLFKEYLQHLNNQDLGMFNQNQIMPVFDYIKYLRNIYQQRQSMFRMKDHSLEKLYDGMLQWHKELGKTKHDYSWEGLLLPIYHKITKKEGTEETKEIIIRELISSNELRKEGKEMKHCVASYAQSCKRGTCAIFTLKIKEFNGSALKGKATIEVRSGRTVQIRSKHNLSVSESDMNYINDWKRINKIS